MDRVIPTRKAWFPQTQQERKSVLDELEGILCSPHFCNSKRYPALLRYIVERTLNGRADELKERTLGIEVFDRPPDYDTNSDTVVRYTAGEVRKRLLLYYSEHEQDAEIHISLPAGSYVPEFIWNQKDEERIEAPSTEPEPSTHTAIEPGAVQEFLSELQAEDAIRQRKTKKKRFIWIGLAAGFLMALVLCLVLRAYLLPTKSSVDVLWQPIVQDQQTVLVCTGSSTFAPQSFSGVVTADKSIDYPFVSLQVAAAISRVTGVLAHANSSAQLVPAATTQLTELRERSVVLIGGHNNDWTMRFMDPLRFHFSPYPDDTILDRQNEQRRWDRDHTQPYSSATDYALVARFRNSNTNGWVMVLAGLGRNGTEAAAQFATNPLYVQQLRDRIGGDLANKNVEVLLQVNVIDGKTGAPTILDAYTW